MPKKTIYEGSVPRYEVLAADGSLDEELAAPVWDVLTDEAVAAAYEEMLRGRALDDAAYRLQRSGRMGTFPQNRGQEAAALGAAMALRKGHDRLVPSYRENGALIHLGVPAEQVLLHWMGDERGNAFDPTLAVSPTCISIGAQILHGAGVAWALKLQDADRDEADRRVAMTIFGDGATSQGDFHEGLNFASTLNAPAVFVCQNNGWAISVPTHKQTASETFAQKALGFGMVGVQADGNDLFASLLACREAVDRARAGEGATLIELTTYRLADHTTADDARRYRPAGELETALENDPLVRTRRFLERRLDWTEERDKHAVEAAKEWAKAAVKAADGIAKPDVGDGFDHVFAEMPPELVRQRSTGRTSGLGQAPRQETLRPNRISSLTKETRPAKALA
jgi:pyruvate dehydrogenase E1 component alpha subunit